MEGMSGQMIQFTLPPHPLLFVIGAEGSSPRPGTIIQSYSGWRRRPRGLFPDCKEGPHPGSVNGIADVLSGGGRWGD